MLITPNRLTVVTNNSGGTRDEKREKSERKQRNFIIGGLLLQRLGDVLEEKEGERVQEHRLIVVASYGDILLGQKKKREREGGSLSVFSV